MKRGWTTIIIILLIMSCKKDKLIGDKQILIGTWQWAYTHHQHDWCHGEELSEVLTSTAEYNYTVKIEEKGIIKFY